MVMQEMRNKNDVRHIGKACQNDRNLSLLVITSNVNGRLAEWIKKPRSKYMLSTRDSNPKTQIGWKWENGKRHPM